MTLLIGLSGSLRKGSYNTALLHAAAGLMPEGATLTVKTIHGIPLYNGDDEAAHGIPLPVQELKAAIAAADGLLLVTPEYNNSIQSAWLPTLRTLGTKPWFGGRIMVSDADEMFDSTGQLTDAALKEHLRKFLAGFVRFAAEERR
jgi:chromate reductase